MSIKPKSHIEIALESIKVFLNDGKLDVAELNFLLGLALRDGVIDEHERLVLRDVIEQAEKSPLDAATKAHIDLVKAEHGLG